MMCEGVTVAKPFVTYLAAVRFITSMGPRVRHEVVTKSECFVAHFTGKGFISCMDACMCY
jgi:hypothetical protein